jgi:DNA-binding beta-propeller fold protein YncE
LTGDANGGSGNSNGIGTSARFNNPGGMSVSSDSSFALVADTYNHMIRKIILSTSSVSLVAGDSIFGKNNGIGTNAHFYYPTGVSVSSDGSFALVADYGNNMIRKIVLSTSAVSLVAGDVSGGYGSNNGIGTRAKFSSPYRVSISSDGGFALVGDSDNNMIRKIVLSTSSVSLVAGDVNGEYGSNNGIGTNARFDSPTGVSISSDDSFALIVDDYNNMIRKIVLSTSSVSLVAGDVNGGYGSNNSIGTNAQFYSPTGVSISSDDSFALVADTNNNMIRKIVLSTSSVSLVAGGVVGRSNGIGSNAQFLYPYEVIVSSDSNFALVADLSNNMIRLMTAFPEPTSQPTLQPTSQPTLQPTSQPTLQPTGQPTAAEITAPFLDQSSSSAASTSLSFIIIAILLVICRLFLMLPQLSRSSVVSRSVTMLKAWWWVGYVCCCGISVVCAVAAVASYAEALSGEPQVSLSSSEVTYTKISSCRDDIRSVSMSALGPFSLRSELSSPLLSSLSSCLIFTRHLSLQTKLSLADIWRREESFNGDGGYLELIVRLADIVKRNLSY